MPDDPHSRDTAFARLLAEALSRSKSGETEQNLACPDAGILATYAEHGLTDEQTARWENHFADCGRCQKIIAVLAASGDELTDAEVETLGTLAAASPAARRPVVGKSAPWWRSIWRGPVQWRWLVPVAGIASAAGLWFALHQAAPRETLSAQKMAATTGAPQSGAAQGDAAASSAKPDETQIAQSNLPVQPALAPPPVDRLRDEETSTKSPAAAKKEELQKQEASSNAVQAAPASNARRALETREYDAKDSRLQSAQPAEPKSERSDALGALSAAAPAAPAASPSPPPAPASAPVALPPPAPPAPAAGAAGGERAELQALDRAAGVQATATAQMKALTKAANPAIVFASPNRRVLWRLGSAGRIEHSADQGRSWQPQSSGVTTDLLAGAAPSETVAWAAGRNGTMLRTEDGGEHWQRVAAPTPTESAAFATASPDWVGVEATDALHATITSRDLRRFATEDGGRTWVRMQ